MKTYHGISESRVKDIIANQRKNINIKDGDIFTISGLKRKKNGDFDCNCRKGTETKWVAKDCK